MTLAANEVSRPLPWMTKAAISGLAKHCSISSQSSTRSSQATQMMLGVSSLRLRSLKKPAASGCGGRPCSNSHSLSGIAHSIRPMNGNRLQHPLPLRAKGPSTSRPGSGNMESAKPQRGVTILLRYAADTTPGARRRFFLILGATQRVGVSNVPLPSSLTPAYQTHGADREPPCLRSCDRAPYS